MNDASQVTETMAKSVIHDVGDVLASVLHRGVDFSQSLRAQGATSLDMVSIQMGLEEKFGLRFATGAEPKTEADRAWEKVETGEHLIELVVLHAPMTELLRRK